MTVMDASAATGINPKVIYAHIHKGALDATYGLNGRYDISPRELHLWHVWMWRTSNAMQLCFLPGGPKSFWGILDCVSGKSRARIDIFMV